jgi:hypothetical protein
MKKTLKITMICVLSFIGLLIICGVAYFIYTEINYKNRTYYGEKKYYEILEAAASKQKEMTLKDIFGFKWDKAFIVDGPYMSGKELAGISCIECDLGRIDPSTPMRRIVFINEERFAYDFKYDSSFIKFEPTNSYFSADTVFTVTRPLRGAISLKIKE